MGGVADFTLAAPSLDTAGAGKLLQVSKADTGGGGGGGTAAVSTTLTAITVVPGAAEKLTLGAGPVAMTAGVAPSSATQVRIVDAAGNLVTTGADATATVTVSVVGGGGGLGGTLSAAASGGVATLPAYTLSLSQASVRLRFTKADTTGSSGTVAMSIDSPGFAVGHGPATQLFFATQPGAGVAGTGWPRQPVVVLLDALGNTVQAGADSSRTITLTRQDAGPLTGTASVTPAAGQANFTGLGSTLSSPAVVLVAQAMATGGPLSATSAAFPVLPATASGLAFSVQPGSGQGGVALAQAPQVKILDPYGNQIASGSDASASVALTLQAGTGALAGTTSRTAAGGLASFAGGDLRIGGPSALGSGKQLRATATLAGTSRVVDSTTFSLAPGPAAALAWTAQPGAGVAGAALSPIPAVQVVDASGYPVTTGGDAAASMTVRLASARPLGGTLSVAASAGAASFPSVLAQQTATGERLQASALLGGVACTLLGGPFAIGCGVATQLSWLTGPSGSAVALMPFSPAPQVAVLDALNNRVTTGPDSSAAVTLSLANGSGTLACALPEGSLQQNAVGGLATFAPSGASLNLAGSGQVLRATKADTGVSGGAGVLTVLSPSFNVVSSAAAKLVWSTAPGPATSGATLSPTPVLQVQDGAGNLVTAGADATAAVTLAWTGQGTLSGTTSLTASGGQVSAPGLSLPLSGSGTLTATKADTTGGGGTPAVSSGTSVTVSAAAASALAFFTQPSGGVAGAAWGTQPQVSIVDPQGNLVLSGADSSPVVTLALQAGTGPLSGPLTATASAGLATFTGLSLSALQAAASLKASGTLTAGGRTATSLTFPIAAAAGSQLVWTTAPASGTSSLALSTGGQLQVRDTYGNAVTTGPDASAVICVALSSGTGVLTGSPCVAAVGGVASFASAGLKVDLAGVKQLTASATLSGGAPSQPSAGFTILPAAASQVIFSQSPSGGGAGLAWSTQPQVTINDAAGNLATTGADATAAVTLTPSSGSLVGTVSIAASGGIATFAGLSATLVGTGMTLTAQKADTTGGGGTVACSTTSGGFTTTPGTATALAFVGLPASAVAGATWTPPFGVQVRDAYANLVTTGGDAAATVALSLSSGGGSLSGITSLAAVGGVAMFSDLRHTTAGSDVLLASATLASVARSTTGSTVTIGPSPVAASVAFGTSPGGGGPSTAWAQQPRVRFLDASGNLVTTGADSSRPVTLSIATGTGNLIGTPTATASGGIATFSGLRIDQQGVKTLAAQAAGSAGPLSTVSSSFSVVVGSPFSADFPFDAGTNASYSFGSSVTMSAGTASLTPTTAVADSNAAGAFSAGTGYGVQLDGNGYLRLGNAGGCDATTTNCSELDTSWTPRYGNIVGYWKLNGSGPIANNAVVPATIGPNLTAKNSDGAGMAYVPGKLGQGIIFDGNDDYLSINDANILKQSAMTVSGWYLSTSLRNWERVFDFYSGSYYGMFAAAGSSGYPGQFTFFFGPGANVNPPQLVEPVVKRNSWVHYAVTLDKQTACIYIDGRLEACGLSGGSMASFTFPVGGSSTYFGKSYYIADPYFTGRMDELAIWNVALEPNEVAMLARRGLASYAGTFTSRVFDGYAANQTPTGLAWKTTLPFLKYLPSNAAAESTSNYPAIPSNPNSVALQNSVSGLWHLNEIVPYIGGASLDYRDDSSIGSSNGIIRINPPFISRLAVPSLFATGPYFLAGGFGSFSRSTSAPMYYSLSLWFKTGTSTGGNLVTFGDSQNSNDTNSDRLIYMSPTGQVSFATYNGGQYSITSGAGFNDNRWHHLAVNMDSQASTPAGSRYIQLLLDGKSVASVAGSSSVYTGYFKLNGNHTGSWPNRGTADTTHVQYSELAIWARTLFPLQEVRPLYRRGANRLFFHVRACQLAGCADNPSWVGPDGTLNTFFSELDNRDASGNFLASGPSLAFSSFANMKLPAGRYFQYRAVFESDDTGSLCNYGGVARPCSPELLNVSAPWKFAYDTASPAISNLAPVSYYGLTSFAQTLGTCVGGVTYNLSPNGSSWYWYTGSLWAPATTSLQRNTAAQLTAGALGQFAAQVGVGSTYFRAFLASDGTAGCSLDDVLIGGTQ